MRGGLSRYAHHPGEGSAVVALCDPSPRSAERFTERFGQDVSIDTDIEAFVKRGLDAAFVISPDYLHYEHAKFLIEHDIAVYLEKPMAISTADADELLATTSRVGGRLYVGHNMRHSPFVRKMRELVQAGAIGEPKAGWCRHFVSTGGDYYFCDWHADRTKANSLLLQKGAHDIDVLHWLMGSYTASTSAVGDLMVYGDPAMRRPAGSEWTEWQERDEPLTSRWPQHTMRDLNPVVDVEDVSMMLMTLQNGTFASYQQCHFAPDYWRSYTIIGTEGRIENFGNGEAGTSVHLFNKRTDHYQPDAAEVIPLDVKEGSHGGADPSTVAEFLRYVHEGGHTDTSPVAARYAVAAGCAAAESIRGDGGRVDVTPVPPAIAEFFGE
jgi:predicted dehydrogenase